MLHASLFSRIAAVLLGLMVLGLSYWFITTSLAPVLVPAIVGTRAAVRFDPSADVSKKPQFAALRPIADLQVSAGETGRLNPFLPPVPGSSLPVAATSSTASSTEILIPPAASPPPSVSTTSTSSTL